MTLKWTSWPTSAVRWVLPSTTTIRKFQGQGVLVGAVASDRGGVGGTAVEARGSGGPTVSGAFAGQTSLGEGSEAGLSGLVVSTPGTGRPSGTGFGLVSVGVGGARGA